MAVERSPHVVAALAADGHEICPHGYRWLDYAEVDLETERAHITRTAEAIRQVTGERPVGWYTGRMSTNTRRLVVADGGFLYDSDDYSDDLPFWTRVDETPRLVVPYSLDVNDIRFVGSPGFAHGGDFFAYARDTTTACGSPAGRTSRSTGSSITRPSHQTRDTRADSHARGASCCYPRVR